MKNGVKSAKKSPSVAVKAGGDKAATARRVGRKAVLPHSGEDHGDLDDLEAIFKSMKASGKKTTHAVTREEQEEKGLAGGAREKHSRQEEEAGGRADKLHSEQPPRPKRDGLYHAPEKTMGMSDEDFFADGRSSSFGADGRPRQRRLATASPAETQLLTQEGVDRIVSMKELQGMLSRNPRAGMTPDCPFGCDCCF